jgi:hypothetical protein
MFDDGCGEKRGALVFRVRGFAKKFFFVSYEIIINKSLIFINMYNNEEEMRWYKEAGGIERGRTQPSSFLGRDSSMRVLSHFFTSSPLFQNKLFISYEM